MAVYAQAPTVQSNPVGTFLNAFQTTQNIFERKRRLSMEEERQQREVERLAKAELRAIETHQKNMRSMEIANDANEYKLDQQREMDDTAAKSLKTFIEEANLLQQEAGAELNSSPGIPDSQLRQRRLINIQRKTAALQSRYAPMLNHPVYGPQAQQFLGNVEQALIPHAEAMAVDQAKDVGSFYEALEKIQDLPVQNRRKELFKLKRDYHLLLGSPQYADRLNNELTAFEKSISDDITLEKTRKEETRKEEEFKQKQTTFQQGQEERTVAKSQQRGTAIQDQIKLMKEMDRVRRLRNDIKDGDFHTGGYGSFWEWIKATGRGGSRNAAMAIADEIATGEWLDNVSKLKGALSDKEGARLSIAGLKKTDDPAVWLEKLNNLLDAYEVNRQFMTDEGRWYVDEKGNVIQKPTSSDEPDFSIFDDPVTDDEVNDLLLGN